MNIIQKPDLSSFQEEAISPVYILSLSESDQIYARHYVVITAFNESGHTLKLKIKVAVSPSYTTPSGELNEATNRTFEMLEKAKLKLQKSGFKVLPGLLNYEETVTGIMK